MVPDGKFSRHYIQEWTEEQRSRIQAAFLEGEEALLDCLENSMVAVYLKDVEGRYVAANRWAEILLGFKSEEVVGRTDRDLFPEEIARDCASNDRSVLESGAPMMFEETFLVGNERRTCVVSKLPLFGEKGETRAICCIATDITERKRAEEALRQSEKRFRSAFENVPIGVAVLGLDSKLLAANAALHEILGYPEEELLDKSAVELTHPEDMAETGARRERLISGELESQRLEKRYLRADGGVLWASCNTRLVRNARGEPDHFVSQIQDITERRSAEEALERSEKRFKSLIQNAPDVITVLDARNTILYDSPAVERVLGYRPEDRLGKQGFGYVHPDDRKKAEAVFEGLLKNSCGANLPRHYRMRHADGSWVRVEATRTNLLDDPDVGGVVVNYRDVTERRRGEEALRESEERFRGAFENASIGMALTGLDRRYLRVNRSLCEMLGYSEEELLSKSSPDITHPEDLEKSYARTEGLFRSMEPDAQPLEKRYLHKDGRTVWAISNVSLVRDFRGKPSHFISHFQDITERKDAEEALRRSEARFRAVFDGSGIGMALVDTEGRLLESNPVLREMLGYDGDELCEMSFVDVTHPDDLEADTKRFDAMMHGRLDRFRLEKRYLRKDGSLMWGHLTSSAIRDREGAIKYMVGMVEDITERRCAEEALRESEERYRATIEQIIDGVYIGDVESKRVLESNNALQRMLGYTAEELRGKPIYELIAHDRDNVDSIYGEILAEGHNFIGQRRYRHRDGSVVDVETSATVISYGGKEVMCTVVRDVSERKLFEERLADERNLLRTLIDNIPDFIFVKDIEGRFVVNNREHAHYLSGAAPEEVVGKTDLEFLSRDLAERYRADDQTIRDSGSPLIDKEELVDNGRWFSTTKVPLRNAAGEPTGIIGISRDITERKAMEESLRQQAFHDSLTGLPNRSLFLDRLEHALARLERLGESVAVLFVDLDDFKPVNDSLGHDAGNKLLVELAGRLRTCVRPGDTVARLFGDEFAVLLEVPTRVDEAQIVAKRINEVLGTPFVLSGQEVFVSSSIGISLGESAGDVPQEILQRADLAMYAAKSRGKARYELFNPSMNVRIKARMELESDLRRAIENGNEFEVHYQPIVEPVTGEVVGLEALLRWQRPGYGMVYPGEFIHLAESTGLIRPIGGWVLQEACRQSLIWRERYPERRLSMSVNFSANQFSHQADLIPKVLGDIKMPPESLLLEITERAVMDNAEFAIGKLQRFKDIGVNFAIDDFGTGYSCLHYLKLMPVGFLKIDRSFVGGLGKETGDTAIVASTINLAHSLNLKAVAEGVENGDQLDQLKDMGCDLVQGFYICKPLPAASVTDFLDGR